MVAELGRMAAHGGPPPSTIKHDGVANTVINQANVHELMDGPQRIESAASSVNEGNGIDAIKTVMGMLAMVIRVLARRCVDVSTHLDSFENLMA